MVSMPKTRTEKPKTPIEADANKDQGKQLARAEIPGVQSLVSAGQLKKKPKTLKAALLGDASSSST